MNIKQKIIKELERLLRRLLGTNNEPQTQPIEEILVENEHQTEPEKPTSSIQNENWCWGGFNGSKAKEDSRCRLSNLKAGNDKLTFHWDSPPPSDWKKQSGSKGNLVIFAVFINDGKGWKGGKADWIDEKRSSRSTENLHGYHGWNYDEYVSAKEVAICVVSVDGKQRSPFVICKRKG